MKQFLKTNLRSRGYDIIRHMPLPRLLQHHQVEVVWDVGANDGRYATQLRKEGWDKKIVSFEPQPKAYQRLATKFASDPDWQGLQMALGATDGSLIMHSHKMDDLSSFLEKYEQLAGSKDIQVPVRRGDTIMEELEHTTRRTFVKIDTQGYEVQVIEGMRGNLQNVIGWQLEMAVSPLYQNQPTIETIIARMRELGYTLWQIIPGFRDNKTLQAFEFDGLFFRQQ